VALNLARPSDLEALPALLARGDEIIERAELLGVPAAVVPARPTVPEAPYRLWRLGETRPREGRGLRVVDLSAMWAGPLCARLLGLAGMQVTKVESTTRPDGARAGDPRFFRWLHDGHEQVVLDFGSASGRAALAELVGQADVVIESSRPRALAQLGIDAEVVVARRPGTTWVSITGYGRASNRVAFGDDAAVAAGLVAYDDDGLPVFCADAIADPISGLYAALGALTSIAEGGGHLVEVAMVDAVAATLATPAATTTDHPVARPRPPRLC
jgi:crotonobetainyl-CoA:carnitine CoA-transferase CaiB-like acyl-CoA transferase